MMHKRVSPLKLYKRMYKIVKKKFTILHNVCQEKLNNRADYKTRGTG